jgi:hypothetical protein
LPIFRISERNRGECVVLPAFSFRRKSMPLDRWR